MTRSIALTFLVLLGTTDPAPASQKPRGRAHPRATATAPATGSCTLPAALQAAVEEHFGTSRVLKTADLFEDERKLFIEEHKAACPGLATGQFLGPQTRPATAMVLLEVGPTRNVRLVVARPAGATWVFVELDTLEAGSTAVLWREPPGSYKDAQADVPVVAKNDVVVLTGYESWRRVYVWNGKTFDRLQTAQ